MDFYLVARSRWGGSAAGNQISGPVNHVVVHHTFLPDPPCGGSLEDEIEIVRRIETAHKTNGWAGIGYTFLVSPTGRVFEGRGWRRTGAHSPGNNSSSIGLCFMMDGTRKPPTNAAWEAAIELLKEAVRLGHLTSDYTVTGHREHQNTACPGDAVFPLIQRLASGSVGSSTSNRPTLRAGDRNEYVMELQTLLGMSHHHQTGFFGPVTDLAVRNFQTDKELVVDGIVGPLTWTALLG